MPDEVIVLEVPGIPPSVNHYKKPGWRNTKEGKQFTQIVTPEALAFKQTIAILLRGQSIAPKTKAEQTKVRYGLAVTIFLGKGDRGDGDNYWKCIADGLQEAGAIHSDARARSWHIDVEDRFREDPRNPRTLIVAMKIEPTETWAEQFQKSLQ